MNGANAEGTTAQVTPISPHELCAKMREGTITVVDAQAPGWYEREHLPGALRVDVDKIDDLVAKLGDDPASEIAVYCWSETCSASEDVAAELLRRGYTHVRRYAGGKRDWLDAGLPVESDHDMRPRSQSRRAAQQGGT